MPVPRYGHGPLRLEFSTESSAPGAATAVGLARLNADWFAQTTLAFSGGLRSSPSASQSTCCSIFLLDGSALDTSTRNSRQARYYCGSE